MFGPCFHQCMLTWFMIISIIYLILTCKKGPFLALWILENECFFPLWSVLEEFQLHIHLSWVAKNYAFLTPESYICSYILKFFWNYFRITMLIWVKSFYFWQRVLLRFLDYRQHSRGNRKNVYRKQKINQHMKWKCMRFSLSKIWLKKLWGIVMYTVFNIGKKKVKTVRQTYFWFLKLMHVVIMALKNHMIHKLKVPKLGNI